MLLQTLPDMEAITIPITSLIVLIFLLIVMIYLYNKHRMFVLILTVHLFSLVIGFMSFQIENFPFSPYLQTFFIVIQTIFLLLTSIEVFYKN